MADTSNRLSKADQELLAKAQQTQARREARSAEAKDRAERAKKLREQRKAAKLPLKTQDEKAADFKRLATHRTNAALKQLGLLSNLGNRSQYAYTDEQVATIMAAVGDAVVALEQAFKPKGEAARGVVL